MYTRQNKLKVICILRPLVWKCDISVKAVGLVLYNIFSSSHIQYKNTL